LLSGASDCADHAEHGFRFLLHPFSGSLATAWKRSENREELGTHRRPARSIIETIMRPILARALLLGAFGLATAKAAEPPTLPPPDVVIPAPVYYPMPYRVSRYEVWQYLGPTRQGFFRPRVIFHSDGAYYYYDGIPAPGAALRSHLIMPYARD
jgi:hypothetical protein